MPVLKRIMDVLLSLLAVIVFMPVFILIAVLIKLDSAGPVLFRQQRIGRRGKTFYICKFRTMIVNAESIGDGLFNYEDDFRVTKIGRALRKTSMDEAPQLINVLKGEMSIVGPRPPVIYEHGEYSEYPEEWKRRFIVCPGVTGLAQVNGRNELTWEQKISLDNKYLDLFKKYGVLIDIRIMLITVGRVICMASTYERRENAETRVESAVKKAMDGTGDRLIWLNGDIVPVADAKINVLSPTAQFGLNVFEGIRCYWNESEKQLFAFRLDDHYIRLRNSLKMLRMEDKYSFSEMQKGLVDVVRANNYREDIAVRQTVFVDGFGSWASGEPTGMFISPIPRGRAYPDKSGISSCISSWERICERDMSPKIKVGANYINSRMAQLEALRNGYDSAIFINSQGKISEGPGSCLFIIRGGRLITPPCTASVLESITRDTLIKIAGGELGVETVERDIDRTELYICDEAFFCGSSMEVVPIASVDGIELGPGSVTERLRSLFFSVVRGELRKYDGWLTPIY